MEFSISKMKEVIKEKTNKRVSEESARLLSKELENRGKEISKSAQKKAEEDGRVTIRAKDIQETQI